MKQENLDYYDAYLYNSNYFIELGKFSEALGELNTYIDLYRKNGISKTLI